MNAGQRPADGVLRKCIEAHRHLHPLCRVGDVFLRNINFDGHFLQRRHFKQRLSDGERSSFCLFQITRHDNPVDRTADCQVADAVFQQSRLHVESFHLQLSQLRSACAVGRHGRIAFLFRVRHFRRQTGHFPADFLFIHACQDVSGTHYVTG